MGLEGFGDDAVVQRAVPRLLEAERGVHLEEERDAVVPGEAQRSMAPERVAFVDDVDAPPAVESLEPEVDVLVEEEAKRLAADDFPCRPGGHAPDLGTQQAREACGSDVDDFRSHAGPARAVARPGGEDAQLRSPRGEGVHQLADVRRPALGADDGNAAIRADVGDVGWSHADTRDAPTAVSQPRSRVTLVRRSKRSLARSRPALPRRSASAQSSSSRLMAAARAAGSPGGTR